MSLSTSFTVSAITGSGTAGGTGSTGSTSATDAQAALASQRTVIGIPGTQDASPRVRQALQDAARRTAELQAQTDILYTAAAELLPRVVSLESGFTRTVLRLEAAQVAALGATPGPSVIELTPDLPPGSHIINLVTNVSTAFVSSAAGYQLDAELFWRANDSVAPDAVPYDTASVKAAFTIGLDGGPVAQYGSLTASGPNDNPFAAGANPTRWPYTPTLCVTLTSGGSAPNMDTYTDGVLEIVVVSATMI